MTFSELEMMPIREHAALLINAYVPSDTNDPRFDHIAKDYGGKGTTCGYLCHWLMWRLGSDSTDIINRNEPGFTYIPGGNITRIYNSGRLPFISINGTDLLQQGPRPQYGDIVYIRQKELTSQQEQQLKAQGKFNQQEIDNILNKSEHVFVFLEETTDSSGNLIWRSADAGQQNNRNQQCARLVERVLKLGASTGAKFGNRDIFGWIPLAELSYNFMPPYPPMTPPPFDPILMGI